ncbi:MAG: hypothetical protein DMG60_04670 [Acidobacteria bacterium]|nr:MAG: hypothetical protein DMG60_04670 [Acidobacteriota bacterium]
MADLQDELVALRAEVAALTNRLYRLEQKLGLDGELPREASAVTRQVVTRPYPLIPPSPVTRPLEKVPTFPTTTSKSFATARGEEEELEGKIGKLWLNRIGIVAILIGVSYFIKYAFDSGWIGPTGRIALGLLAGIALIFWSERFRARGHTPFSYSLKAVGIGTLYLSLWGAFQVYHLVPSEVAFVAMILVTASTITLALTQDAEILAAFAMIGGFSTPLLLSTGQNHEIVLFSYVCLLDLAMLAMVRVKPWRRLLVGSFTGTMILYIGWFGSYYTKDQRALTTVFTLIFAVIFAVIPLLTPLTQSRRRVGVSVTLTLLPLANATAVFFALKAMYENETLTWFALALAAAYLFLSSQFKRRLDGEPEVVKTINLLHVAIAVAFITIAIPLKLNSHWITLGWLVESAVLLYISVRTKTNFLRYFAAVTLSLGIIRLLIWDNFRVETLIFNARFATYLVAIAILGGIVVAASRFASERERPAVRVAGILLNVLALAALTLEASDYFRRQIAGLYQMHDRAAAAFHQIDLARNFSYSLIWLAYGAGLMMFGFGKRSAFVRWQALVLIALTIGKVFVYDVEELQQGYRILSFIALGGVLMGISYVYHRDWLKLAAHSQAKSTEVPST